MAYTATTNGGAVPATSDPFAAIEGGLFAGSSGQLVTGTLHTLPGILDAPPGVAAAHPPTALAKSTNDQLLRNLVQESPAQIKDLQTKLIAAGSTQVQVNGIADAATINAYTQLLNYTALYQQANPNKAAQFTPDELLNSLAAANPNTSKTTTDTSTSVHLTDKVTAAQTLQAAFASKLGRRPTDDEVSAFTEALNNYETQNPTNSTSVIQKNADNSEKSSQTTTSGKTVDPSAYALNYLQDNHGPEQTAVNHLSWFNVALNALQGGAVQTGNTD